MIQIKFRHPPWILLFEKVTQITKRGWPTKATKKMFNVGICSFQNFEKALLAGFNATNRISTL